MPLRIPSCVRAMAAIGPFGLALLAGPPAAGATFSLEWTATTGTGSGTGTPVIEALPGDFLTLGIFLEPDSNGVSLYSVSLRYDLPELEVVSATELLLIPEFPDPLDPPGVLVDTLLGQISSFDASTFPLGSPGPISGRFRIGEITFRATHPVSDGQDVFTGFFHVADGCTNNAAGPCSVFGTATVNLIPEPSTGLLLALGLTGLASCRRTRRTRRAR